MSIRAVDEDTRKNATLNSGGERKVGSTIVCNRLYDLICTMGGMII